VFLLLLLLDGLVCMVVLRWVVFVALVSVVLVLAGLLHVFHNCCHHIEMIAFTKLRQPYLFAARITSEPCVIGLCLFRLEVKMKIIMVLTRVV
jgi:hypothetical protein